MTDPRADVAVIIHRNDRLDVPHYFLHELSEIWRAQGHVVRTISDPSQRVDAPVAVNHVNLTVVPDSYREIASRYPTVINGAVTDVSKRVVSRNLVRRRDRYGLPVIVKTDQNYGGQPERRLEPPVGPRRPLAAVRDRLPWSLRDHMPGDYPVFPSARQVPPAVWPNRTLVVERFLPERLGEHCCVRTWLFLGDQDSHSLSWGTSHVVKSPSVVGREQLGDVPPRLRELRAELGFDYGKFDYGLVDGEVVLWDANRTPAMGGRFNEISLANVPRLAEGLSAFV